MTNCRQGAATDKMKQRSRKTNPFKALLRMLGAAMGLALIAAVIIVLNVIGVKPAADRQSEAFAVTEDAPLSAAQATDSDNAQVLARALEDAVPTLNGQSMAGQLRNATFEGRQARVLSLRYAQAEVLCVRPVTAAPLLLQDSLSIQTDTGLSVLSMPATYAAGGGTHCLYFSGDTCAYAFIASDMTRDEFFALAASLTLTR